MVLERAHLFREEIYAFTAVVDLKPITLFLAENDEEAKDLFKSLMEVEEIRLAFHRANFSKH